MTGWKEIVPERFEKEIAVHILRILGAKIVDAPLILGIDGPPGQGKTYQCKLVLKRLGVKMFCISAGKFESREAGEPARLIRDTYELAGEYVKETNGNMSAIIIDDADVAFGNWGELYQYTVNTQNVIGELMGLADKHIENDKKESFVRIPIFLTGNDLSKIYAPLKRDGRMNFYYWEPNEEEMIRIVYHIFDHLDDGECKELVQYINNICIQKHMSKASVSFYSDLASRQYDDIIWDQYTKLRREYFGDDIINNMEITDICNQLTLPKLKQIAVGKLNQIQLSNRSYIDNSKKKRRR